MNVKELEQEKKAVRSKISAPINNFQAIIMACYAKDYSQRQEIVINGVIPGVVMKDLLKYGIRSNSVTYSSIISERVYILFIDSREVMKTPEAFNSFAREYSEKFLPQGTTPSICVFNFDVQDYNEFATYMGVVNEVFPRMSPLYTSTALRTKALRDKTLDERIAFVKPRYNVFLFDKELFKDKFLRFTLDSSTSEADAIMHFCQTMDDLVVSSLEGVSLVVSDEGPPKMEFASYFALALAYLTFKYRIPVWPDNDVWPTYVTHLNRFYCSYDAYPAYDRIKFLREYPKLCYAKRSFMDFFVYILPENRKLVALVEYIRNGEVMANEVDLLSCEIYPSIDDSSFENELVELEARTKTRKFLHVGNCLYMDIGNGKELVHIVEIRANYDSILSSCDKIINPFKKKLTLRHLLDMIPAKAIRCDKGDGNESMLHEFIGFLYRLSLSGKIEKMTMDVGVNPYIPDFAMSGIGPVITEFTRLRGDCRKFPGIDSRLVQLYEYYGIQMRNYVIDRIAQEVPLKNLRESGNYLTLWGAKHVLNLHEALFKTTKDI